MRAISSLKFVGVLAPPTKFPTPLLMFVLGAGKMPALSNAVAFGLIMQVGILLPGKGEPGVTPAPAGVPPGQFAYKTELATREELGTMIGVETELKSPP